jgi:hypothetical protein
MKTLTLVALAIVSSPAAAADEKPITSRIVSVGLFKNGLAVVRRQVVVPSPGTYRLDDVLRPVHGTYWVDGDGTAETRVEQREVDVPVNADPSGNLQEELAGKTVTVHLRDGKDVISGTVVQVTRSKDAEPATARYNPYLTNESTRHLILQTGRGRVYLDASQIGYVEAIGLGDTVRRKKPITLLNVTKVDKQPATIQVHYLARGLAWAPSYRVDISDGKTLTVEQSAVVKNELGDLKDAEVFLISGYPSVQYGHVTSPLAANSNWTRFFEELNARPEAAPVAAMQSGQFRPDGFGAENIRPLAAPVGEGVDLHLQTLGKRTLAEGDALHVSLAKEKSAYERIVQWLVPDTRDAMGRYLDRHRGEQPNDDEQPWDALRFKNPFRFPMTTGAAMVVANGRFNGQRLSGWVNAGEETVLPVTRALSIRTLHTEHEEQLAAGAENRTLVFIGGWQYRKTTVQGELTLSNHRAEAVTLLVRRRFSGDLLKADSTPKSSLLEEGVYSVNKRNELAWAVTLKPGEEKKLTYRYAVLVAH